MKKWACIFLVLTACQKQIPEKAPFETDALFGVITTQQTPELVLLRTESGNQLISYQLEWLWPDGQIDLFAEENDALVLQSNRKPQAGDTCVVFWKTEDAEASARIVMPQEIHQLSLVNDTLQANSSESVSLSWTSPGAGYEFVLELKCIEDIKIPIGEGYGDFSSVLAGPQVDTTIVLPAQRFTYYGTHKLVIYSLNPVFSDFFFFDPSDIRGLVQEADGNVQGGKGLIFTTSVLEVFLEIE